MASCTNTLNTAADTSVVADAVVYCFCRSFFRRSCFAPVVVVIVAETDAYVAAAAIVTAVAATVVVVVIIITAAVATAALVAVADVPEAAADNDYCF